MRRYDRKSLENSRRFVPTSQLLSSKRKISELIIDQLDDAGTNADDAKQPRMSHGIIEIDEGEIENTNIEAEKSIKRNSKSTRVTVDDIFDGLSQGVDRYRRLIDSHQDEVDIDEMGSSIDEARPSVKSKSKYDVDEILEDESRVQKSPELLTRRNFKEADEEFKPTNLIKSSKNCSKRPPRVDIDSFLSLSLEEPDENSNHPEETNAKVEEIVVSGTWTNTPCKKSTTRPRSHHYDVENLLSDDESSRDTDTRPKTPKKSGLEWLKELNETTSVYLDEGDAKKTSPQSLLTVNTSNIYVTENEIKKRKTKYLKNGLAEKLQKLLIRQTSSINFVKHNMNKKHGPHEPIKQVPNIIKAIPVFKQASIGGLNFCLVHAFQVHHDQNPPTETIRPENYILLLLSHEKIDSISSKYFDKNSFVKSKIVINIYPPWRRMLQKDSGHNIYFCTDLIEVVELETDNCSISIERQISHIYSHLSCPGCPASADCRLVLFDRSLFSRSMKLTRALLIKQRARQVMANSQAAHINPSFTVFSNSQTNNYMFYTQNDGDYYTQSHHPNLETIDKSQYMRLNSILDALEHTGYYGFVTFIGRVKRVFNPTNPTQRTQSRTQYTQNSHQKLEILVSDKCGMFAMVWVPSDSEVGQEVIMEFHKYQFNSLKFVEKQILSERDNPGLYEQVKILWDDMNHEREIKSKPRFKSFQRMLYVFEFIGSNRSSIELLGESK